MTELTADGFPEFFQAVRGYEPFPWQAELAGLLVEGDWPDVIDVPTGLGKTSVMDCWVYALAAAGAAGVPRRLFFVVDRRLVVDGAFHEAEALARTLADARLAAAQDGDRGVVASVAAALHGLHGDPGEVPLEVVRMRGGVTWESRWLARPDQAALVVGTVSSAPGCCSAATASATACGRSTPPWLASMAGSLSTRRTSHSRWSPPSGASPPTSASTEWCRPIVPCA